MSRENAYAAPTCSDLKSHKNMTSGDLPAPTIKSHKFQVPRLDKNHESSADLDFVLRRF